MQHCGYFHPLSSILSISIHFHPLSTLIYVHLFYPLLSMFIHIPHSSAFIHFHPLLSKFIHHHAVSPIFIHFIHINSHSSISSISTFIEGLKNVQGQGPAEKEQEGNSGHVCDANFQEVAKCLLPLAWTKYLFSVQFQSWVSLSKCIFKKSIFVTAAKL